jgi:hypothetical protein
MLINLGKVILAFGLVASIAKAAPIPDDEQPGGIRPGPGGNDPIIAGIIGREEAKIRKEEKAKKYKAEKLVKTGDSKKDDKGDGTHPKDEDKDKDKGKV